MSEITLVGIDCATHLRNAGAALLAARDLLSDRCLEPTDSGTARKEGWIWRVGRKTRPGFSLNLTHITPVVPP